MKTEDLNQLGRKEEQLRKLIKLSALTVRPLQADFDRAVQGWRSEPGSQFWGRVAIRCLCAAIEATLFSFRKMAEQMAPLSSVEFSSKEVEILTERRVVTVAGIESTRPKYLPLHDSVKESFRLFAKSQGTHLDITFDDGYDDLVATFGVRNRLMHPKGPFDVEVRESDMAVADRAVLWFNSTYVSVLSQCKAHLNARVAQLRGRR